MKRARRWTLRLLAAGVLFTALAGPAPGNVRGCGQSAPRADDPVTFCHDKKFWTCRREQVFGRLDEAGFEACTATIDMECSGFTWPSACSPPHPAPLQSTVDACILLLRDPGQGPIPTETLLAMRSECSLNTLCPE